MRVYQFHDSGNCYKVRLLCAQLGLPVTLVDVDITRGEGRTAEFLLKNPNGRVPTLELDDGTYLPESGAILFYLADGSAFLPGDRLRRAKVLQWMFFEQYSLEPFIATSRKWIHVLREPERYAREIAERRDGGLWALRVLQTHLDGRQFLIGEEYTIADIMVYGYTHVAHEGGFPLDEYPAVRAWIERVRAQPGYIALTDR